jgi:hypothetical protein
MASAFTRTSESEWQPFKQPDRRFARRYLVRATLKYRVLESTSTGVWNDGHTINMSSNGIFIETAEELADGSLLELRINWLGLYHARPVVRLLLSALVVRTDDRGAALRILDHEFRDARQWRVGLQACLLGPGALENS